MQLSTHHSHQLSLFLAVMVIVAGTAGQPWINTELDLPTSPENTSDELGVEAPVLNQFGYHDPIVWEPSTPVRQYWNDKLEFYITSDLTNALEVILFVSGGLENYFWLSVFSSNIDHGRPDPHLGALSGCHDVTSECGQQRYLQYTTPPLIEKGSKYRNRIIARVQPTSPFGSLQGKWTVIVSNDLPIDGKAFVRLEVRQKRYTYIGVTVLGFLATLLVIALLVVAWDHLAGLAPETTIIRPGAEDDGTTQRRTTGVLYSRVTGTVMGWYRALEDERGTAAGGTSQEARGAEEGDRDHQQQPQQQQDDTASSSSSSSPSAEQKPKGCARSVVSSFLKATAQLALAEAVLLTVGFVFKVVAGLLTNDLSNVIWSANFYHHVVAIAVILSYRLHRELLGGLIERLFQNPILQVFALVLSLFLEVIAGYFGQYLVWVIWGKVWDWQIYFCLGFFIVLVHISIFHESVKQSYVAWRRKHRIERVVEPDRAEEELLEVMHAVPVGAPAPLRQTSVQEGQEVIEDQPEVKEDTDGEGQQAQRPDITIPPPPLTNPISSSSSSESG